MALSPFLMAALNVSAESLLTQAGLLEAEEAAAAAARNPAGATTADAIGSDPKLKPEQRTALLAVYQSYVEANLIGADAVVPDGETSHTSAPRNAKKPRATARGSSGGAKER